MLLFLIFNNFARPLELNWDQCLLDLNLVQEVVEVLTKLMMDAVNSILSF